MDETLRWSTLAPFAARFSEEDMDVAGYKVPAHTPMIHALGVALLNETQWKDVDKWVWHSYLIGPFSLRVILLFCSPGLIQTGLLQAVPMAAVAWSSARLVCLAAASVPATSSPTLR